MKEELTPQQETLINEFAFNLEMIDGPDDMFPPDNFGGVRVPRKPLPPFDDMSFEVFAPVYDLEQIRAKKRQLVGSAVLAFDSKTELTLIN